MIDVAFAAIDLATPVICVGNVWVEGQRRVELAKRLMQLRRFDEGACASDIGLSQILTQGNRLVEVGKRFRPGLLFISEVAAGKERDGILRFKLDRKVDIRARQIEAAAPLAQISAQQQSRDKVRIQLKRCLDVTRREIQLRTAGLETRAIGIGVQSSVAWTRRVVNHRGASRLDLLGAGAI